MFKKILLTLLAAVLLTGACLAEPIIAEGAKNAGVRYLQEEMRTLGYFIGEPDGVYGLETGLSVAAFARDQGLDGANGVDGAFLLALNEALGVTRVDVGSAGTSAYAVQKMLYNMGFMESAPDGKFGEQTRQAVVQYMKFMSESAVSFMQGREDVRAAAILATNTDDMPVAYNARLINTDTVVTNGAVTADWFAFMMGDNAIAGRTIGEGSPREDVRRVQRRLRALGYTADTRVDGMFGSNTARVLKYFQRRNGLPESGICDQATQNVLFTSAARESDKVVAPYMAYVDTENCKVYIYGWDGDNYNQRVKVFTCSTGAAGTPTQKGTYQAVGQISPWYYMPNSNVWVQYAFQIEGNYFFHSVLFHSKGATTPTASSVRNLGSNVSHGCIRLAVDDVKWIYENCTPGMTVVIK